MTISNPLPRTERELRRQSARRLGPSDVVHLERVARHIEDQAITELPGVDAERIRLLARKLERRGTLAASLRGLVSVLCGDADDDPRVVFVFVPAARAERRDLTPAQYSDLAVVLLDEVE